MRTSPCLLCAFFILTPGLLTTATAKPLPDEAYAKAIGSAQEAADAGKNADAQRLLNGTTADARGYEFDYVQARVERNAGQNTPAPTLINLLKNPADVQTRYAALHPKKPQVAFICRDGGIRVNDLTKPDATAGVYKHPSGEAIWSGVYSGDGQRFFTGHQNGDVLIWDTSTWKLAKTINLGGAHPVREMAVSPDGQTFGAEAEKAVELWTVDGETPKKVADIGPTYNFGEGLAISPKGDVVATGGMFDIIVSDLKTGKEVRKITHASYTMGIEFSPDGKRIASAPRGNVNKFLGLFDATTSQLLYNRGPFGNYVAGMAFSPDGKRIAATGCENLVRIFDASDGQIALTLRRPGCSSKPGFSRDGRLLGWNEPDGFHWIDLAGQGTGDSK